MARPSYWPMMLFSSSGVLPVISSTSTPRSRKIAAARGSILSEMRTLGMIGSLLYVTPGLTRDPAILAREEEAGPRLKAGVTGRGQPCLAVAYAQSSQGPSASMSAVSTVAPHQMRRPGGASR